MRRKKLLGWTLVAVLAAAAFAAYPPPDGGPAPDAAQATKEGAPAEPQARFAALPERQTLDRGRARPFAPRDWRPPPPSPPAPSAPAAMKPPPMPYRVAGTVIQDGAPHPVLAKGDRVLIVSPGDVLEDGYRVDSIGADSVTLVYLPLGLPEHLPMASMSAAAPAESAASGATAKP